MNIRREIETLALWYIPVFLAATIASAIGSGLVRDAMADGTLTMGTIVSLIGWVPALLALAPRFVVAAWLFGIARREGGRSLLWLLFGLVGHLFAAVIYLALKIYEQRAGEQTQAGVAGQAPNSALSTSRE